MPEFLQRKVKVFGKEIPMWTILAAGIGIVIAFIWWQGQQGLGQVTPSGAVNVTPGATTGGTTPPGPSITDLAAQMSAALSQEEAATQAALTAQNQAVASALSQYQQQQQQQYAQVGQSLQAMSQQTNDALAKMQAYVASVDQQLTGNLNALVAQQTQPQGMAPAYLPPAQTGAAPPHFVPPPVQAAPAAASAGAALPTTVLPYTPPTSAYQPEYTPETPVTPSAVLGANPELAYLPTTRQATPSAPLGTAAAEVGAETGGAYTVVSGDTLSAIARRTGQSLAALEAKNTQIKNLNLIYPGQRINI